MAFIDTLSLIQTEESCGKAPTSSSISAMYRQVETQALAQAVCGQRDFCSPCPVNILFCDLLTVRCHTLGGQRTSPPTSAPGGSASCAACAIETDSYLAESRCIRCRALLLLCRECVRRAELATPSEGRITVNYSGFVQRKLESWENGLPLLCALCDTREQSGELKKPLTRTMASKPVFIEGKGWAVDE